jgi:hypothetical protein
MQYKKVDSLGLNASDEDRLLFEINWLTQRVRNLELIVHELLRDRINKELADGWVDTANDKGGWTPTIDQIKGRGEWIAAVLDAWPADKSPSSVWPTKPKPGSE